MAVKANVSTGGHLCQVCQSHSALTDDLGTDVRKGSLRQNSPETKEFTECAWDPGVLDKGTGVLPELETMRSLVRTSSGGQDDTEDDETDDGEDLDGRKPEFTLPIDAGPGKVDCEDNDKADGDPDTVVDRLVPVIDEYGCC